MSHMRHQMSRKNFDFMRKVSSIIENFSAVVLPEELRPYLVLQVRKRLASPFEPILAFLTAPQEKGEKQNADY